MFANGVLAAVLLASLFGCASWSHGTTNVILTAAHLYVKLSEAQLACQ